ncbi:hypothetical protein HBA53_24545 (plasmid) [Rhodococcus pyridinivorans]|uniref:hypothetical protein n=1 Tax=Rhodococcus pyridinivorans TaxID=103816 RepID=UPI001C2F18B2|nr:hypothetical protein [Rhodococcus pyridinivorans]QXF84282.1 hypothetical protein HBA53_24545 [Rhodococcus pyridinivorans]
MGTWRGRYHVPDDSFPLGERVAVVVGANGYTATYVSRPIPYVIVSGTSSLKPTQEYETDLEQVRCRICRLGHIGQSASIPKLAVVSPTGGVGAVFFRGRLAAGRAWHPRVASTGLLALGIALSQTGTTASLIGGQLVAETVVDTPAGLRTIGRDDEGFQTVITLSVTVLPFDQECGSDD